MPWDKVNNGVALGIFQYLIDSQESSFSTVTRVVYRQGQMLRAAERMVAYCTEDYAVDPGGRKVNDDWRLLDKVKGSP